MQPLQLIVTLGLAAVFGLPAPVETGTAVPAAASLSAGKYSLSAKGPGSLAVGKKGKIRVVVQPSGGWHMNLDFPVSLKVTASSGLTVESAKLKAGDAKRLDDGGLEFELPVQGAAAGDQAIKGLLKFAVCREGACAPAKENIAVKIKVK